MNSSMGTVVYGLHGRLATCTTVGSGVPMVVYGGCTRVVYGGDHARTGGTMHGQVDHARTGGAMHGYMEPCTDTWSHARIHEAMHGYMRPSTVG